MASERAVRVGFIGLGTMGEPMARNLMSKGFPLTVWNRSPARAAPLVSLGATLAADPRALAQAVDVVCTCVSDPAALEQVMLADGTGAVYGTRQGQLVIDFSTVSVGLDRRLAATLEASGASFIDAPVTGSRAGAEKGTLVVMAGGEAEALERARPVLAAVSSTIIHCGPTGAGTQVKLAGNALIASMLEAFSEGILLTRAAGVDPRRFLEVVQASGYRSPYFEFKGKALLERDFSPMFSIGLMFKDLTLFIENAAQHRVPVPLAGTAREIYAMARAAGKGDQDISAAVTVIEDIMGQRR